ncbi:WhiB family transcriptional regulator [Streptomyces fradiae]|uniref:WhiB family transcriptional regulator n=1 Tax=Streptomyces fradiae TaxID=1906 RepID=UPI0036FCF860
MTTETRRPITPAATATSWQSSAACRTADPELFFPVGKGPEAEHRTAQAKRVCATCPVQDDCRTWALETGQTAGIWGGTTEADRWDAGMLQTLRAERRSVERARPAFDRCLAAQDFIEERYAAGVSLRRIGQELGVGYDAVRRALRFFEEQAAAEQAAAAGMETAA